MMQTPLFAIKVDDPNEDRVHHLPDGHRVTRAEPPKSLTQIALARFVDNNGKRDWVVWTRTKGSVNQAWRYHDGLEFGSDSRSADMEFQRRMNALLKKMGAR